MTVVKEDEAAGAEGKDQLEAMSESKLPDDWSIIGGNCVDNEGSDGESVEVIACDEEKVDDSGEGTPQDTESTVALKSVDKSVQTEVNTTFQKVMISYQVLLLCSVIIPSMVVMLFLSENLYDAPSFEISELQDGLRPELTELIEDWKQTSPKTAEEKASIIVFLNYHFPLKIFDKQVIALLERDIGRKANLATDEQTTHHSPSSPYISLKPVIQLNSRDNADNADKGGKHYSGDDKYSCQNCESGNCKKHCKHGKRKGMKYYINEAFSNMVKKFPKLRNRKT